MKNKKRIYLLFAYIFLLYIDYCTANENDVIVVNENQLNESFIENINVSGGVKAGLMLSSSSQSVNFDQLNIYLGEKNKYSDNSILCVSMISNDGRYSSHWEHHLDQQNRSNIKFSLQSKHKEQLADYTSSELVVLASIAEENCYAKQKKYVPASWGFVKNGNYVLFINSGGADASISITGNKEQIYCERIINGKTIAYDKKCEIEQIVFEQAQKIVLHRSNFNNTFPDIKINLK